MGGFGMMDSTSLPFCFTSSSLVGVGGLCAQTFSSGCFLRFVLSLGLFSKFFGRSSGSGDVFSTWLWHLTYWLWQIL
jgi:hypothetical protein